MYRLVAFCATALLASHFASASARAATINVHGKMSNGSFVTAVCTVGPNGQVSGTGVLYGSNPQTGTTFKYPFVISRIATGQGAVYLYGKLAAGPEVRIAASVPNGPMTFTYVINGIPYTLTGQGTVTVVP